MLRGPTNLSDGTGDFALWMMITHNTECSRARSRFSGDGVQSSRRDICRILPTAVGGVPRGYIWHNTTLAATSLQHCCIFARIPWKNKPRSHAASSAAPVQVAAHATRKPVGVLTESPVIGG